MDDEAVLAEQKRYYDARAPEYDDWWFRRGRYDNGPEQNASWFADVAEIEAALERLAPAGDVLELAGGTGLWTRHLVRHARRLTVVDASAEVLAINRERVGAAGVEYIAADVFGWRPERRYDVCCFGFWLSHVPESRFEEFWRTVASALQPHGRVFLVDGTGQHSAHTSRQTSDERAVRTLADGRVFEIVKRFYDPDELAGRLATLGWQLDLGTSSNGHFLYGSGSRV